MLRYTFRQMRASLRSLVAVSTAVIVSTGFVAAALIGSSAMTDALYNMVSAKYAGADLVVYPPAARIVPPIGAADAASAVEGIEAARPLLSAWIEARTEGHSEWVEVTEATRSERLNPQPVTEGHEPAGADEASLGAQFAKRLGVGIGDQFEFVVETFTEPVQADTEPPADDAAGAGGEDGSADEGAGSGETSPADSASATGGDDNNTDGGAGETASDTDSAVGTVGEDRGANEGAGETASDTDSDTEGGGDETSVDQWDTTEVTVVVTVSGLFDDSGPTLWSQPGVQAAPEVLDALGAGEVFGPFWWDSLAVAAAEGADLAPGSGLRVALGEAIAAAAEAVQVEDDFTCESGIGVDALGPTDAYSYPSCEVQVLDMDQQSAKTITEFMGGVAILTAVVLIFGLIGLLVAAMAISNTYQVLIAGRTRTL
ncbi:MAG: hypothetical protein LBG11_08915, partial [Bifidobacteriaceae bacterium]|nr:hypothetical protein [Bifidobacteriaceae bacterium]